MQCSQLSSLGCYYELQTHWLNFILKSYTASGSIFVAYEQPSSFAHSTRVSLDQLGITIYYH